MSATFLPPSLFLDDPHAIKLAWRRVRVYGGAYLAAVLLLLLGMTGSFSNVAPEVSVPGEIGVDTTLAVKQLSAAGLQVTVQNGERSDRFQANQVMRQSIDPGMHVRRGRPILITRCTGPLHVKVPDVRAVPTDEALNRLTAAGLVPVIADHVTSKFLEYDRVLSQSADPGMRLESGATVSLIISDGPPDDVDSSPAPDDPSPAPAEKRSDDAAEPPASWVQDVTPAPTNPAGALAPMVDDKPAEPSVAADDRRSANEPDQWIPSVPPEPTGTAPPSPESSPSGNGG